MRILVLCDQTLATLVNEKDLRAHGGEVLELVAAESAREQFFCEGIPVSFLDKPPRLQLIVEHHSVEVVGVVRHELLQFFGVRSDV